MRRASRIEQILLLSVARKLEHSEMNERIKLLAEQARKYADDNEQHWKSGPSWDSLFEAKFAELIVRECCSIGEQYADGLFDPKHYAFVNKRIRKNFGVEE
jgi:hypothetical protein